MNLKLTAVALLSLCAGALLAYELNPSAGPASGSLEANSTGKARVGGPFSLTDHTGKRVTDQDFRGRYMLVYFGYTFCPDVCPASLQVISSALDQLGPLADNITPVFITMDPERDTPEKLSLYLKSFHPRLIGLTGTQAEIASALKAYRVYAKKVPDEQDPKNYTMDHSSVVYLMGHGGDLVTFVADSTKLDALVGQLRKALTDKR